MIDLRSDTVTKPDREMREAARDAAVGDDVYGEDPTVNELEARAADLVGTEAALYVPTGTWATRSPPASTPSRARRPSSAARTTS